MTDTLTITNPIPMTNGGEGGGAGTAGGIFYINVIPGEEETDPSTLDKTWNEIKTAVDNGMLPVLLLSKNGEGTGYIFIIVRMVASHYESYDYYVGADEDEFISNDPDDVLHSIIDK